MKEVRLYYHPITNPSAYTMHPNGRFSAELFGRNLRINLPSGDGMDVPITKVPILGWRTLSADGAKLPIEVHRDAISLSPKASVSACAGADVRKEPQGNEMPTPRKPAVEAGQIWSYHAREQEKGSRVVILGKECLPAAGVVVHIALSVVSIRQPATDEVLTRIQHLPVSEPAVLESLFELESEGLDVSPFTGASAEWRRTFQASQAGIWIAPLAEIIQSIEDTLCRST
jgi:hypothetical protein